MPQKDKSINSLKNKHIITSCSKYVSVFIIPIKHNVSRFLDTFNSSRTFSVLNKAYFGICPTAVRLLSGRRP